MKILLNPHSEILRKLRKDKKTPYLFDLFWDTIEVLEYKGSPELNPLEAIVPSELSLGIPEQKRKTGISKLEKLGLWKKLPAVRLSDGTYAPTKIKLLESEAIQFKFSLSDKFISKYEGEEVEINGVKFIAPEWLNVEEMKEDLSKWVDHVRGRVGFDRGMFETDLHKNFPELFKYVQQECDQKPHLHNIYSTTKNGSISKNNVINRCIEKGYTSFNYALSQKELLHNVVESSAKLSTNSKSKTVSKSSEIDINLAIHNTLKQLHESLVSKKDIAAFFSEKEDQKKLFFGHISNIQKLKKKSTELPEKYLSRLFALMTKKKEFYSDAQKRQLRDIYEVRRKKGELLRADMTLKEFIQTCEDLKIRPSEKEPLKA